MRERLVEVISLHTLSAEGTAALIGDRFGQHDVSPALRDAIHERTEGNPFFTEEVLSALVEAGAIFSERAGWERRAIDEILLPQSVKAVIGQRVGRLTIEAQEMLRTACVLGQEFELDVLLAASGQEESVVLDGLDAALAARGCWRSGGPNRGERYAFAHALIGQVLYDETPRHRLRRLHVRAGEALERVRGDRPDAAAEVARHFLTGGAEDRALPYLERAGDHAVTLYAHDEALSHYQTAVDLRGEAGDESGLAVVRRRLAGALARLRRMTEAVALYEQALAYYTGSEDRAEQAAVAYEIGMAHRAVNNYSAALPHLETAFRLWPVEYQPALAARLYMNLALLRLLVGVPQAATEAMPLVDRGLALAEQLRDLALQVHGLGIRANIAGVVGGRWAGGAVDEPVMELARRSGDRETRAAHPQLAWHGSPRSGRTTSSLT